MELMISEITIGDDDLIGTFYICLGFRDLFRRKYVLDRDIAEILNLPLDNYVDILKNNEAFKQYSNYYFRTRYEAEQAIKDLEPYLIMVKLYNIGE